MLPTIVHPSYSWGHLGQPVTWQKSMWGMGGKPSGVFVNCVGIKLIIKWNMSRVFHKYLGYMEICTLYMKNHWRVGAYLTAVSNLVLTSICNFIEQVPLGFFFPWCSVVCWSIYFLLPYSWLQRTFWTSCMCHCGIVIPSLTSFPLPPCCCCSKVLNSLSPTTSPLLLFQSS